MIKDKKSKPEHFEFLAGGKEDPRKKIVRELKNVLGKKGSIIVYYQSFEKGRLEELGEMFPKEKKWVKGILARIVDLIEPFQKFDYYDCKQEGSCSIKDVLPALTGKSYEGMDISSGEEASLQYFYSVYGLGGKEASGEEVRKIRESLRKYCGMDTEAMMLILEQLKRASLMKS